MDKNKDIKSMPQHYCQSCGMPLMTDADCGTEKDGSLNHEQCHYCYADGHYTQECTMEEMIDLCAQYLDEYNKHTGQHLTTEEYKELLRQYFPTLKRWKK